MNIKALFTKRKIEKQLDLRQHPNAVIINKGEAERIRSVLIDLAQMNKSLTKKDIKVWRQAWQLALSTENPKRNRLLECYRDTLIDNHLSGAILQRKLEVIQRKFKIVDPVTGEEKPELTKLLRSTWFIQFMNVVLDTPYYGYTLIQLGDIITIGKRRFDKVTVVDRAHVIPEYSVFVKHPLDNWGKGIDYSVPPYSDWCIAVGDPGDLGLLLKVTPQAISKRHMEAFWDTFGEVFGMPIRIGKTSSRDPKDRRMMEQMLSDMGAAAWGLFPQDAEIEIKETTRGDAYNVYDKRIARCEASMSKAVLGQTMTIEDGSSKSQSETHHKVFQKIVAADADMVRQVVTDELLPRLNKHGFGFGNVEFEWDDTASYTPEQEAHILEILLNNYTVDPRYITEKYNIPVQPKPTTPQGSAPGNTLSGFFD